MGWFLNGVCRSKARLDGKTAVITGSNTGIGKITALDFIKRGARVIIACRDTSKGNDAADDIMKKAEEAKGRKGPIGEAIVMKLDLASLSSVRNFAKELLAQENKIHLLINNAGIMMCPWGLTEDGFEMHLATNHLGHFLLTLLLLPAIINSAPARIVNVSSLAHKVVNSMHFDDINLEKSYQPVAAYGRSKLANILFTKMLAEKLKGTGVTTYSLHPGVVNTELTRHVDTAFFPGSRWLYHHLGNWMMKTPEQGAQTTLYCALEESIADHSGRYYDDCKEVTPSAAARNPEMAKKLWEKSIEMVQLDPLFDPFTPAGKT